MHNETHNTMTRFIIIISLILFSASYSQAQSCYGFHLTKGCDVRDTDEYKNFSASRSVMVEAQRTYQYQLTLYGGYDYKVGLCTEKGYYPIHFKIINADDNSVFYDNYEDDYVETVGFTNDNTRNVIIEVTLLASKMEFRDSADLRACLGIAFFWRKVPKLGF